MTVCPDISISPFDTKVARLADPTVLEARSKTLRTEVKSPLLPSPLILTTVTLEQQGWWGGWVQSRASELVLHARDIGYTWLPGADDALVSQYFL